MATQWYCRLMGSELGPFTSKQLLEMARSHQLMPDVAVKKETGGMWVAAHRVKGLFDDPAASSIIMASLPPDVQHALAIPAACPRGRWSGARRGAQT